MSDFFYLYQGEKNNMKTKTFLITFAVFCFAFTASAQQQEDIEFQATFDKWENSVLPDTPNSQGNLLLMAKVSKDESTIARIKLAFRGLDQDYKITVTPLKYEKDANGKLVKTEFTDDIATVSTRGKMKLEDFHSPTIITFVNAEANAIEISLETAEGKNPKITLSLKDDAPTVGTLNSVN